MDRLLLCRKGGVKSLVGVMLSNSMAEHGIFNMSGLQRLVGVHKSKKRGYGNLLFRLLSVELWFREFMDREGTGSSVA